ncbi:GNAT family N-acetyltransferase [Streptomyces sp. ITFR-16]|uniref:GNAT family N-acetyltransferase n=1 Tax=Streptomyces sp. ITFR-16 TaxID=3075198 RepID=UPI00288C3848|nr:GNAT family N-acetyltransferase [Streptomyces sp. ITFR-16]WNI26246.1 GNAT family N-acetyltransferase [Streptomyces sp. ITFR-16]
MGQTQIRRRRDADMKACLDALFTVYEEDRYPARWPADPAGWLTPDGLLAAWVAVAGPDVLGHVALTRTDDVLAAGAGLPPDELASVSRLFARASARRRGVAQALLDVVADAAASDGRRLVLEVEDGGAAAVALYERAGWRRTGSRSGDWTTADGRTALLHTYLAPDRGAGKGPTART